MLNQVFKLRFFLFTLVLLLLWVNYIYSVDPDLPFADQFPLMDEYKRFRSGELTFKEIWAAKGGHRFPGYKITFFLNCLFFGFSPKLEIFIAISAFALTSTYLVYQFSKELAFGPLVSSLVGVTLALLLMNGQSIVLSVYSLIAMRLMNISWFILTAVIGFEFVAKVWPEDRNKLVCWGQLFFVLCISILFFGRGWGIAASLALMTVTGVHMLSTYGLKFFAKSRSHFIFIGTISLILLLYFSGLSGAGASSQEGFDVLKFGRYAMIKFGNANLGLFSEEVNRDIILCMIVSCVYLFLTAIFTIFYLVKGTLTKGIWLALFLVYFSIFCTLMVSLSRYDQSPFSHRHNIELAIGIVGIYFLLFKLFSSQNETQYSKFVAGLLCLLTIVPLGQFTHEKFDTYKFLRNHHNRVEANFQTLYDSDDETTVIENSKKIGCVSDRDTCLRAVDIMKEYGVSEHFIQTSRNPSD